MATELGTSDHDEIIGGYTAPPAVIATKPDADCPDPCPGAAVDLRHNYWVIRTDDPEKVRDAERSINFGTVVDVGGVKLSDDGLTHDLLTAKIMVLEMLRGQYLQSVDAKQIYQDFRYFLWIVRWRQSMGIRAMRDITPALFDEFCIRMQGGVLNLVPFSERIAELERRIVAGQWSWPKRKRSWHARKSRGGLTMRMHSWTLFTGGVLSELGLNSVGQAWSEIAYNRLWGAVERTAPELLSELRFGQGRKTESLGVAGAHKSLAPWVKLNVLSRVGRLPHDPLPFDPFATVSVEERKAQIAKRAEEGAGRTGSIPPDRWLALLDIAARWVLDYSRPIISICEEVKREQVRLADNDWNLEYREQVVRRYARGVIDKHLPADRPGVPKIAATWTRPFGRPFADDGDISIEEALTYVVAACVIMTGAFAARRRRELESLREGCAYKDPFGDWWLSSYIEKTIRDISEIPVPSTVGFAVQILEEVSKTARDFTGSPWITDVLRPSLAPGEVQDVTRPLLTVNMVRRFQNFTKAVGLFDADDPEDWQLLPHQLRRAFALYYYHGNRHSSLDALSRFLRHFDPEMTRRYINEAAAGSLARLREIVDARAELAESSKTADRDRLIAEARAATQARKELFGEWEDVRQEAFVGRALEVHDGIEEPIGYGAAALREEVQEMAARAKERIHIVGRGNGSPDEMRQTLSSILREAAPMQRLEPVPGRHAHCRCRPDNADDLAKAACLTIKQAETGQRGNQPDYAYASTTACLGCVHGVAFSENVRAISAQVSRTAEAAAKAPGEAARVAAQAKLAKIKAQVASAKAAAQGRPRA